MERHKKILQDSKLNQDDIARLTETARNRQAVYVQDRKEKPNLKKHHEYT